MNINLHIEQFLLEGINVTPRQLAVLKASFETRLGHLLAQEGIGLQYQKGETVRIIQTDSIGPVHDSDPSRLGELIAQSVHGGLG